MLALCAGAANIDTTTTVDGVVWRHFNLENGNTGGIESYIGAPEITIVKGESPNRVYRTLAARTLDGTWDDVTSLDLSSPEAAGYRFFKVAVALP